jgi:hypothetical protein
MMLAAKHNLIAGDCYAVLLTFVIDEFRIEKADAKIKDKLRAAEMLPFTTDNDKANALKLELLS